MEWRRKCFEVKPSEEKDEESDKDKGKDEETCKEKEKGKFDDPSDKEKLSLKETTPSGPKDPEVDKEIPPGFNPKSTADPRSKGKNPKDVQNTKA